MIAIVGSGPAGLLCAKEAAFNGKKVVVFEEHEKVGEPMQCSGLVSKKGLDNLGVDYEETVLNRCVGTRIFSPSGKVMEIRGKTVKACVIDRAAFDRVIAEEAMSEGVEIRTGEKAEKKAGDILVGADGAGSLIAKTLGNKKDFVLGYQITAKLERDEEFVELHFGPWSKGFFAWVIPESETRCRIGIGIKKGNPQEALKRFLIARKINVEAESSLAGLIPIFRDSPTVFPEKNTLLIGDAADQVKASTGGGIAIGGFCARIAGEVIGRDLPLADYAHNWQREFKRELLLHRRIHYFMSSLTSREMEELFEMAIQEGIPKIIERYGDMDRPSVLFKHLLGKPRVVATLTKYVTRLPF